MNKLITIFEVLADGVGDGPACDGTHIHRFRKESEANNFAKGKTLYGKNDVPVTRVEVPKRIAQRWGF